MISDADLIERANSALNPRKLAPSCDVANVASALVTELGEAMLDIVSDDLLLKFLSSR